MMRTPDYAPGDVVGIAYKGICHTGIVSEVSGSGVRVIHKSKRRGRVVEEPLEAFAAGRPVERIGYPGHLTPEEVVGRARARIGEPWEYRRNCQRFCASVHGAPMRSRDADKVVGATFGLLVTTIVVATRYAHGRA